jgi:hypothetical protein
MRFVLDLVSKIRGTVQENLKALDTRTTEQVEQAAKLYIPSKIVANGKAVEVHALSGQKLGEISHRRVQAAATQGGTINSVLWLYLTGGGEKMHGANLKYRVTLPVPQAVQGEFKALVREFGGEYRLQRKLESITGRAGANEGKALELLSQEVFHSQGVQTDIWRLCVSALRIVS